jgi:hypothetical protein
MKDRIFSALFAAFLFLLFCAYFFYVINILWRCWNIH